MSNPIRERLKQSMIHPDDEETLDRMVINEGRFFEQDTAGDPDADLFSDIPTPKRIGILRKDGEAAPAAATGTGDGNGFTSAELSGVYLVGASGSAVTGDGAEAGLAKGEFKEEDHPRAEDGKFGAKTGGGVTHHAKTGTQTHKIPSAGALQAKPTEFITEPPKGKVKPEIEKGLALTAALRASAFDGKPKYIFANKDGALRVSREKPTEGKYSEVNATYSEKDGYSVTVDNYEVRDGEEPKLEPVQPRERKDKVKRSTSLVFDFGWGGQPIVPTLEPGIEKSNYMQAAAQMAAKDKKPRYIVQTNNGTKILSTVPTKNPVYDDTYTKITSTYKKGKGITAEISEMEFDPDAKVIFTPDQRAAATKASKVVSEKPAVRYYKDALDNRISLVDRNGEKYKSYKFERWNNNDISHINGESFRKDDFSKGQLQSMGEWTHIKGGCYAINAILRGNVPLEVVDRVPDAKKAIEDLSSMIDQRTVGDNIVLFRFVNPSSGYAYDKSDYTEMIRNLKPGETYMDSSFTATSINSERTEMAVAAPEKSMNFPGGVLMRIYADPSTHGMYMGDSKYLHEAEILLQHHTVLECISNSMQKVEGRNEEIRVVEFKVKSQGGPVKYD
jgi:hypothetical protein